MFKPYLTPIASDDRRVLLNLVLLPDWVDDQHHRADREEPCEGDVENAAGLILPMILPAHQPTTSRIDMNIKIIAPT